MSSCHLEKEEGKDGEKYGFFIHRSFNVIQHLLTACDCFILWGPGLHAFARLYVVFMAVVGSILLDRYGVR